MTEQNKSDSPCINVCRLDPVTQVCDGCYRTIEEIAGWMNYSDDQKAAIQSVLPARRIKYGADEVAMQDPMAPEISGQRKRCGRCNGEFSCGLSTPGGRCWCASLPHISPPIVTSDRCLCPKCLTDAIEKCASGSEK